MPKLKITVSRLIDTVEYDFMETSELREHLLADDGYEAVEAIIDAKEGELTCTVEEVQE